MCGRFAFYSSKQQLSDELAMEIHDEITANYNVGPGQSMLVVCQGESGKLVSRQVDWGIKPDWENNKSKLLINARAETVHQKATFKESFKQHRCVIVADGWFEWQRDTESKQPYYFSRSDNQLLTFAGLLFGDKQTQGLVLTRPAPKPLANIHHRAPFILTHEQIKPWLGNTRFSHVSDSAINAFDSHLIQATPVSNQVNSSRNNSPELIKPL